MTYDEVMQRLQDEGYENVHGDGHNQIIVNNRGEIDFDYDYDEDGKEVGTAEIYDRCVPWPNGSRNHPRHETIEALFDDIQVTWTKEEPK